MTSPAAVRSALAAQITAQTGLPCAEYMPDQINPPQAAILPGSPYAKYGVVLEGGGPPSTDVTEMNLVLAVFVSRASSLERAQQAADQYVANEPTASVTSIPEALDYDPTLGGIVEWCIPQLVQAYGDIEIAGQTYFQARITVYVSVHGDA